MVERYWAMMTDKHFDLVYLGLHHHRNVLIERWLDIILAVTSTGALGALIICDEMQIVLTIVLAITQVITSVRPYMPFHNRMDALDKGISQLNVLYNKIESKWNQIATGKMDDEEINRLYYEVQKEWEEIESKILKKDSLPRKSKFIERANEENEKYFNVIFGGNAND